MIEFKQGGAVEFHPGIRWAFEVITRVWATKAPDIRPVITSCQDSVHGKNSRHYGRPGDARCWAIDIRSKNLQHGLAAEIVNTLRKQLGPHYDILYEQVGTDNEHIHLEVDFE
jgi:hypothetical protein